MKEIILIMSLIPTALLIYFFIFYHVRRMWRKMNTRGNTYTIILRKLIRNKITE